ncbi:MAG: PIG-L family deacetylase [Pseudomonadota bacterium]|nr:PIG-L family deacetylase [Pseudomonadota bacterium]
MVNGLPTFSARTRLLVVAPHPDDETLAAGILIQQVRAAGGAVRILLLTAGDNNPWPQRWVERRLRIGPAERRRWGSRRHAEILAAMTKLDLPPEALQPLGWPDMGLTDRLMQPGSDAVTRVAGVIEAFAPSLVVMPSIADRHPDHGAAHVLVRLAIKASSSQPQLLTYLVHGRTPSASRVEITGSAGQQGNKLAALREYYSQMVLSGDRMRRWAARPECYVDVTAAPSASTCALPWRPLAWMRPWLRLSLASASDVRSWRWSEAPLQQAPDGSFHLTVDAGVAGSPAFAKLAWDLHTLWIFDHWGWCEL